MRTVMGIIVVLWAASGLWANDAAFDRMFQAKLKEARTQIQTLSADALFQKMQRNDAFVLLDVREREEVVQAGAPVWGRYLHVSRGRLEMALVGLGVGIEDEVVVMCRNSIRSFLAAVTLKEYGFKKIWVLDKGMDGWVGRNYPTHHPFGHQ